MNFEATPERIARLDEQTAFANLAMSKKRKDAGREGARMRGGAAAAGRHPRRRWRRLTDKGRYMDRAAFEADLKAAAKRDGVKLLGSDQEGHLRRPGRARPGRRDLPRQQGQAGARQRPARHREHPAARAAPSCRCPMAFGPDKPNDELVEAFRDDHRRLHGARSAAPCARCLGGLRQDQGGYEIPINRHFYVYKPPRPLDEIEADIRALEGEIAELLEGIGGMSDFATAMNCRMGSACPGRLGKRLAKWSADLCTNA